MAADESFPAQAHNFIVVVVFFMVAVWFINTIIRVKHLYELWRGVMNRTVIRIDGLRQVNNLSHNHLKQILRAKATHTT
jgi:hypothetical protein